MAKGLMDSHIGSDSMAAPAVTELTSLDFDAIYRGESPLAQVIGDLTPWDIEGPQPIVVELELRGEIKGEVLDAGCGLGDNAFFIADKGYRVTAFDGSPTAIRRAEECARARGIKVDFVAADATSLASIGGPFDTILDSALYHCLDRDQRERYVRELRRVCRLGGTLHLSCFSDMMTDAFSALNCISQDELREAFAVGWTIEGIRRTGYATAFTREHLEHCAVAFGLDSDELISTFGVDAQGRFLAPSWVVTAKKTGIRGEGG